MPDQTVTATATGASFRTRLFTIFTVLTFFISLAFIALHGLDKAAETRRHAAKEVHLLARQLADSVRLPLFAEDRGRLEELAQTCGRAPGICRVSIGSADGRTLVRYPASGAPLQEELIGETVEVRALPAGNSPELASSAGDGTGAPLLGTVRVERGTDDLRRSLDHDVLVSALLALCFWLAVTGLSFPVLRRLTRSYNALVRGVRAMQEGDYASRIEVLSSDEPGRVAQAVNGLAATLQKREEENARLNRQLVASIETEIRAKEELGRLNRSLESEIAERANAERAARGSEEALRSLMDLMPVGVLSADPDGRIDYLNGFLVGCFGYLPEELPTLDAWFGLAFPDPLYRGRLAQALREALAEGKTEPVEARVTCRDGRIRRVMLSSQATGSRTILIAIDITDRELMQEQTIKVQKLESLGVLAGGIAHNFNNALTGVLGYLSLANSLIGGDHEAREYLQFAMKASIRASEMARQLLTFASGGAPIKKPVALQKIVEEVASLTHNVSNVRCQLELPAVLPLVRGDEGQLVQAFSNIVINAMQAMPEGGTITVRAETGLAGCPDPNHVASLSYLSLSFTDQGHGIPEGDLPKIFDPYFSTKQSNTGLGLASVHSIIYKHGGHVSVSSRPGLGTTFTICLPTTYEPPPGEEPACRAQGGKGSGTGAVLVMDDEEMIREFSERTLEFLGYRAVVCADGAEAVRLYGESLRDGAPFFAAILDLTVPGGMGGVEAARQILDLHPQARLIVSSGYSYDPVMARHREYGFCAAVAKPYKAEELGYELRLLG